ncbi:hypothetical protein AB834_02775 [PVC group bacterium (ex Bugula neritina AB1)]|nr:hypothetical protein AB834_02775 [PVC group bacterium (ex Bugula neritina AB1)]
MRTSNPVLSKDVFSRYHSGDSVSKMTVQGVVSKTAILFLCVLATASWSWAQGSQGLSIGGWFMGASIFGFILAIVMAFKPQYAPVLAPAYSLCQGVTIGFISSLFERSYPGLVMQAVVLTFSVLGTMLFLYKARIIQATDRFRRIIMIGMGAIFLVYFMSMILSFFSVQIPMIHSSGPIGILFSFVVIGFASFSLIMDFDFIEQGSRYGAPKYMEWYASFGLIVTLIWIYMEILRLLAKLSDRR